MFVISDSDDVILLIFICLFKNIAEILFNNPTLFSVYIDMVYFIFFHYSNLTSETDEPEGIIGNTLSSFSIITSKR